MNWSCILMLWWVKFHLSTTSNCGRVKIFTSLPKKKTLIKTNKLTISKTQQKKPMARTITRKTKGNSKKRPKDAQPTWTKEGKKLVPLMVRSCLIHIPSNIACMQIVSSSSNRRFRTSISCQHNLPLYNKGCNLPFQSNIQWKTYEINHDMSSSYLYLSPNALIHMVFFSFLEAQQQAQLDKLLASSKVNLISSGPSVVSPAHNRVWNLELFFGGPKVPEWPIPVSHALGFEVWLTQIDFQPNNVLKLSKPLIQQMHPPWSLTRYIHKYTWDLRNYDHWELGPNFTGHFKD
jgi:hypothetical protein